MTNHARLVLATEMSRSPHPQMADRLGLTEKGVMLLLRDLRESGYVTRRRDQRDGRRSYYTVVPTKPFRKDTMRHHTVGELLHLLSEAETSRRNRRRRSQAKPAIQAPGS